MSMLSLEAVQSLVIDTFSTVSGQSSARHDTEVLELLDSVSLIIALADLQAALDVTLEPEEIIEIFQCRTLGDIAVAVHSSLVNHLNQE